MQHRTALLFAISSGFLAVLLGAFGAHALKAFVPEVLLNTWKTASFYHFVHTVVLLIIVIKQQGKNLNHYKTVILGFFIGMILFSGSLYVYVISQIKVFAMIAPVGGLILLFSWAYWFKTEFSKTNK